MLTHRRLCTPAPCFSWESRQQRAVRSVVLLMADPCRTRSPALGRWTLCSRTSHMSGSVPARGVWGVGSPVTPSPSPVPPPCPRHFPGHACVGRSRPAGPLVPPLLSKHIQCKTGFHNFCSDIWEGGTPQHCDLGQSFELGGRAEAGNQHS